MEQRMVYQTHLSLNGYDREKEEEILIKIPAMTKISIYRLGLEQALKLIKKGMNE